PGFVEADLVAHSGSSASRSFVQTLVLTDVATGWTECAPLLVRKQNVLSEVLTELRKLLPFNLLGLDTDNDSVFMNETVHDYCQATGVVFTRCRPYRKNDQAFVEQKNSAVVRRIVGYRRLEGLEASTALARLYATVRLSRHVLRETVFERCDNTGIELADLPDDSRHQEQAKWPGSTIIQKPADAKTLVAAV